MIKYPPYHVEVGLPRMSFRLKIEHFIVVCSLCVMTILMALPIYWLYVDVIWPPFKVNSNIVLISRSGSTYAQLAQHSGESAKDTSKEIVEIERGDIFYVHRDLCVRRNVSGWVRRYFQSQSLSAVDNADYKVHLIYQLAPASFFITTGCGDYHFAVPVPTYVVPGDYVYRSSIDFQLNPLRDYAFVLPDIKIRIVASSKPSEGAGASLNKPNELAR